MRNFYCVQLHSIDDDEKFYIVCPSYTDAWDELRRNERDLDNEDIEFHVVELSSAEIQNHLDNDEDSVSFRYPLSAESLDD